MAKKQSHLLMAVCVNSEVESNQVFRDQRALDNYLPATLGESPSQNSGSTQLTCSLP